ncbi:ABC transporter substrate-binding protein [Pseudomonas sp. NW5]|uniref:ABC transporter substrate-binding protein n=1 Tax=Pseudomonas sp. NW5 TaxID=2934934 RepID=UPI00202126C1|nr:ABC transporter substrate-binding protein [Pseudomonas sp. NW5]MCL7462932.1 ABC transporter substrate-binding protein [Pseudomonas sp. NW5]
MRLASWMSTRRLPRLLRCLGYALLLCFSRTLQAADIHVISSNDSPALHQFVEQLQARRPQDRIALHRTPEQLQPDTLTADSRLVLLGSKALDWRLSHATRVPTLALQVSRVQAHQQLGTVHPKGLTLLWSDPPLARQLHLLRLLLPQSRRIGVLYSAQSAFRLEELQALPAQLELQRWDDRQDNRPLNRLLERSEVLLALDDPSLFNPQSIKTILLASYGRRQAMIGPTAAFIRAGSLSSTYSDQQDWLQSLNEWLDTPPERWPQSAYPRHFKVLSNPQVARSLGIELPSEEQLATQLRALEQRP